MKGVTSGIGQCSSVLLLNLCVTNFSHRLSDEMVTTLNPFGKQTANFECEFFALFCAFLLWGDQVTDAVVIYTDNNGARDSLISCVFRNVIARKVLIATMALECTKS